MVRSSFDWSTLINWSRAKVYDLSQPTTPRAPPFPTYPSFKYTWIKRLTEHHVNAQMIQSPLHVGTHFDGQLHFMSNGADISNVPIEYFIGEGLILDISETLQDFSVYTPDIVKNSAKASGLEVKNNDILILHTHYHEFVEHNFDDVRYILKHPGPNAKFADWCIEMKLKWLGIDTPSLDHPLNWETRNNMPDLAKEAEAKLGNSLEALLPFPENYAPMHLLLFPAGILHIENLGGEIDQVLNKRCLILGFPFKFEGGESAFCRAVAITS
jgi:arylformamidase